MSDILIRGMELEPGRISELIITPDGSVYKNKWDFCVGLKPIGQAVELQPHGDLVDATQYRDVFMNGVYDLCADDPDNNRANAIIDLYDYAPVVIPGESDIK